MLHSVCEQAGHVPVAYVYGRSMKPRSAVSPNAAGVVGEILDSAPPGMDLLLPGSSQGLAAALPGYRPDLLVVYGFNWRIPQSVLRVPRLGAINVHPSLLPKHRGPAPVLWAIRNGEPDFGVTIHRMDDHFDSGNIIAQQSGIPLDDDPTPERMWLRTEPVIRDLLARALQYVAQGLGGEPQDESQASHEGFLEPEFSRIDWSHRVRDIHNQVRTFRSMRHGCGPVAQIDGRWVKVLRTSIEPGEGVRMECADGPLWIVEAMAAEPPVTPAAH